MGGFFAHRKLHNDVTQYLSCDSKEYHQYLGLRLLMFMLGFPGSSRGFEAITKAAG